MMTYSEFEIRLLLALVEVADASERRQCEALEVAKSILVKDQWVSDAVRSYENRGYIGLISRPLMSGRIVLTISGEGRKAAENLKAQIAEA